MSKWPEFDARLQAMVAKDRNFRKVEPTRIELPVEEPHAGAFDGPEWKLQNDCEAILSTRGVMFRFHMDRPKGNMDGVPDLLFAYRPAGAAHAYPCAVELKVKGGTVKPNQEKRAEQMQLDGWIVGEAWNVDEFRAFLDKLENQGGDR